MSLNCVLLRLCTLEPVSGFEPWLSHLLAVILGDLPNLSLLCLSENWGKQ